MRSGSLGLGNGGGLLGRGHCDCCVWDVELLEVDGCDADQGLLTAKNENDAQQRYELVISDTGRLDQF